MSPEYRINYGNGQVSSTFASRKAVWEAYDRNGEAFAWVQKYEPGTADEPGEWFTAKRVNGNR